MLETIPGTAGVLVPPAGYLAGVRELCDRHGIVWVADEVMCGFGRAGDWFAFDHDNVSPDLITFAKGVNSGYVPLGGVVLSDAIAETFDDRPYPGGLTYSGHLLACAAAQATITVMREEGIVERARRIGSEVLGPGLARPCNAPRLHRRGPGSGRVLGSRTVADRSTREPLAPYGGTSTPMAAVGAACIDHGVLPIVNGNRVHVVPPCTITDAEAKEALAALDNALSVGIKKGGGG